MKHIVSPNEYNHLDCLNYVVEEDGAIYEYDSIEELFADSKRLQNNVAESGLGNKLSDYILRANELIRKHIPINGDIRYREFKYGHRCTVFFRFLTNLSGRLSENLVGYVVGLPYVSHRPYMSQIRRIKESLNINKNLIIYEDDEGFRLMHYGHPEVDWSNINNLALALAELRKIHSSGMVIDREPFFNLRILEHRFRDKMRKEGISDILPLNIYRWIDENIAPLLLGFPPVLCHGDAAYGNVIVYDGKVEWIDWEFMGMSNPMFDVFYFFESLYGGGKLPKDFGIRDTIRIYLGEVNPTVTEKVNIAAMGIYFLFFRVLNQVCAGYAAKESRAHLEVLYEQYKKSGINSIVDRYI